MKAQHIVLVVLVFVASWPLVPSGSSQTPPSPPVAVDLQGSIQPPIQPAEPPRVIPPAPQIPPNVPSAQLSDDILAWDSAQKEQTVTAGTTEAHFKFSLTNVSHDVVTVLNVHSSCGCTTAQLPPMPWKLEPGTNSEINVTMNLAGKSGTVAKTITISTDKGTKMLLVKTIIGPPHAGSTAIRPTAGKTFSTAARQNLPASHRGRCHVTDSMAWISGLEDPKGNAHAPVKVFST